MNEARLRDDRELLAAAASDPEAFATFYRRHVGAVLAYVGRHAGSTEAGDLVAETFAAALVHRRRFDPARGDAGAWLTGIARHKIADARRRGAVDARLCRRLGIQLPTEHVDLSIIEQPDELLAALPPDQRRIVEARVIDEQSYAEIARRESVSEQVVRKRLSRALAALRARSQEET